MGATSGSRRPGGSVRGRACSQRRRTEAGRGRSARGALTGIGYSRGSSAKRRSGRGRAVREGLRTLTLGRATSLGVAGRRCGLTGLRAPAGPMRAPTAFIRGWACARTLGSWPAGGAPSATPPWRRPARGGSGRRDRASASLNSVASMRRRRLLTLCLRPPRFCPSFRDLFCGRSLGMLALGAARPSGEDSELTCRTVGRAAVEGGGAGEDASARLLQEMDAPARLLLYVQQWEEPLGEQ